MTRKRMVGPRSDGDFAMSIGMGGGRIRKGASVVEKKKTAKPESSMKTEAKATRTRSQLKRLAEKLDQASSKQKNVTTHTRAVKRSPDDRKRINIEGKGGLRADVKVFKKQLEKDDANKKDALRAYKDLHFSKYKAGKQDFQNPEQKRLSKSLSRILRRTFGDNRLWPLISRSKDPTVRKVVRKNKKQVKEEFKKRIKKDRVERKLDESKKRRQRK